MLEFLIDLTVEEKVRGRRWAQTNARTKNSCQPSAARSHDPSGLWQAAQIETLHSGARHLRDLQDLQACNSDYGRIPADLQQQGPGSRCILPLPISRVANLLEQSRPLIALFVCATGFPGPHSHSTYAHEGAEGGPLLLTDLQKTGASLR